MNFGSLFSGIGGMDLGLERAGMVCKWQVEINPFCQKVLTKHWPEVPKYGDIRGITTGQLISVDVIAGGFPCQDISTAGRGIGIIGERSGLWKEFARLVAELRPKFVFAENVPALRNRGLAMVLQDLWSLGYDSEWHCLPACALGAPHERDRIWIVAYTAGMFREAIIWGEPERTIRAVPEDADVESDGRGSGRPGRLDTGYSWQRERPLSATHLNGAGLEVGISECGDDGAEQPAAERSYPKPPDAYSEPLVRAAIARGERSAWTVEPGVVRMVHGVSNRVDRLRGLGNSVVPQVVEWVGRRIMEAASTDPSPALARLGGGE